MFTRNFSAPDYSNYEYETRPARPARPARTSVLPLPLWGHLPVMSRDERENLFDEIESGMWLTSQTPREPHPEWKDMSPARRRGIISARIWAYSGIFLRDGRTYCTFCGEEIYGLQLRACIYHNRSVPRAFLEHRGVTGRGDSLVELLAQTPPGILPHRGIPQLISFYADYWCEVVPRPSPVGSCYNVSPSFVYLMWEANVPANLAKKHGATAAMMLGWAGCGLPVSLPASWRGKIWDAMRIAPQVQAAGRRSYQTSFNRGEAMDLPWNEQIRAADIHRMAKLPWWARLAAADSLRIGEGRYLHEVDWDAAAALIRQGKMAVVTLLGKQGHVWFAHYGRVPASTTVRKSVPRGMIPGFPFKMYISIRESLEKDFSSVEENEKAAIGVCATFGGKWAAYLQTAEKRCGWSRHDAAYWLPLEVLPGLGDYILRHLSPQVAHRDLAMIAAGWTGVLKEGKQTEGVRNLILWLRTQLYPAELGGSGDLRAAAAAAGVTAEQFPEVVRAAERATLAPVSTVPSFAPIKEGKFTVRRLDDNDPTSLFLGVHTGCCQHIGGHAAAAAEAIYCGGEHAAVVIETDRGIVAQTWAWRQKNAVVFDTLEYRAGEIPPTLWVDLYRRAAAQMTGRLGVEQVNVGGGPLWKDAATLAERRAEYGTVTPLDNGIYNYDSSGKQWLLAKKEVHLPPDAAGWRIVPFSAPIHGDGVIALEARIYPECWQNGEDLINVDYGEVVISPDGEIFGYWLAEDRHNGDAAYVDDICIHPESPIRGKTLIKSAITFLRLRGYTTIKAHCRAGSARWLEQPRFLAECGVSVEHTDRELHHGEEIVECRLWIGG